MASPVSIGAGIEALVVARIYQEGGRVCTPFDHGMGYDLISDFDGELNRVEVKKAALTHSRPRAGQRKDGDLSQRWEVDLRARNMSTVARLPSPSTSDVFIVVASSSFYILPTRLIVGRQGLVLRPPGYEAHGAGGPRPSPDPETFRENWSILRKAQS